MLGHEICWGTKYARVLLGWTRSDTETLQETTTRHRLRATLRLSLRLSLQDKTFGHYGYGGYGLARKCHLFVPSSPTLYPLHFPYISLRVEA